jgi:hypothetical protein
MAAGDLLLDASGNAILDAAGNLMLSDGLGDACCCGNKCFRLWLATFDCDTLTWSLTPDGWYCLPGDTDQSWTGSGCYWQRYVATGTDCTVDGDCSALADTATPPPPGGGAEPADCCTNPCSYSCGCRTIGRYGTVTFDSVENGFPCTAVCGSVPGGRWHQAGTGSLDTYRLVYYGPLCQYSAYANDVTFYDRTDLDNPYTTCPPDMASWATGPNTIFVLLTFDGATTWHLSVHIAEVGPAFEADAEETDCVSPLSFTNTLTSYNNCPEDGPLSFMINGTAVVSWDPCTP